MVICRSNNGMLKFLLHHFVLNHGVDKFKWTYYGENSRLPTVNQKMQKLERFVNGAVASFEHDKEEFQSLVDLREYIEESQDLELGKHISLIEELNKHDTSIEDFINIIKEAQVEKWREEAKTNGIILMTCHAAKGLEFDSVYVSDDFPFSSLMDPQVVNLLKEGKAFPYLQEAKDIIYVAVTRARKKIFLAEGASAYINFLDNQSEEPPGKRARRDMYSMSGEEMRHKLGVQWEEFEKCTEQICNARDIPLPRFTSFSLYAETIAQQEMKRFLGVLLRRYHPDKFLSRFEHRLQGVGRDARNAIKSKLQEVTIAAGDLRRALNRPSDPYSDF